MDVRNNALAIEKNAWAACLGLLLLVALSVVAPLSAEEAHTSATCQTLEAPEGSFESTDTNLLSSRNSVKLGAANSWRAIDTHVVLPSDFAKDPATGIANQRSDEEIKTEARLHIAQANVHLRPLQLYLRPVAITLYRDPASDPFARALTNRNAHDMLQTGVLITQESAIDSDFTLVLAKQYFKGLYGLAYSAVSCQSPDYSVAFATQGGSADRLKFMLAHTIAHETGHYLGMSHDEAGYQKGVPVMASRPATHEFGFSETSIQEAQARIATGLAGGSCFTEVEKPGFANDRDFDSIPDEVELAAGANPNDPGSYPSMLNDVVHTPWNSFLDTINIVELSNPGLSTTDITFRFLAQDGEILSSFSFTLEAGAQRDIILNELPGFTKNAYGLVRISFEGTVEGRTAFYRAVGPEKYEFAYAVPLLNAIADISSVSFNTYQPSFDRTHAQYQVANWLSLVNLSNIPAAFRIVSFDQRGNVLRVKEVTLAEKSRLDIDGGHGFAGEQQVGLHTIIPANPATRYLSFLTRYGSNGMQNRAPSQYFFAFPLLAKAGTRDRSILELSALPQQDNWTEVSNTSGATATAELDFYAATGELITSKSLTIPAMSQQHIHASQILRDAGYTKGSVELRSQGSALLAYSMHYYRAANGSIEAMFGLPAQLPLSANISGSYNRFLSADNLVRITNPSDSPQSLRALLNTPERLYEHQYTLAPRQTLVLDAKELGATADSYGVLQVQGESTQQIIGSLLRIAHEESSIRLAIPTTLR